MQKVSLPGTFVPLLSSPLLEGRPGRDLLLVEIRGKEHGVAADLVSRAAALTMDALFTGGMLAAGLHRRDVERFTAAGFDEAWGDAYKGHLTGMMRLWHEERETGFLAETERWAEGGQSAQERARELLREIARTAQPAGVRDELRFQAADLQSFTGVRDALLEARARVQVPKFRAALLTRGLSEARLQELEALGEELFEERCAQLLWQGQQADTGGALPVLKAMALGDLTLLSQTARALLSPDRAERYQLGRLLGTAPRERREDPPAPDAPTPAGGVPGPAAGPAVGPGPAPPAAFVAPAPAPAKRRSRRR